MLRRDAAADFLALCDTMTDLRREDGCPWDRAQTLAALRGYLLEEAHEVLEVLDALEPDGGGPRAVEHKEELGDLLLQIVFQAEIQREAGRFDVGDVCRAIRDKLVRRHPHLFDADGRLRPPDDPARGEADSTSRWEALKRAERAAKGESKKSALDGVPRHLPALLRAYRTGEKARGAGFDWPTHAGVLEKIEEELGEVKDAIARGDKADIGQEIGDLLYAVTNLARHFEIDAESALRSTIGRFEARFRIVEELLAAEGKTPERTSLEELEEKWQQAKKRLAAS